MLYEMERRGDGKMERKEEVEGEKFGKKGRGVVGRIWSKKWRGDTRARLRLIYQGDQIGYCTMIHAQRLCRLICRWMTPFSGRGEQQ
jgi:hypothetical protein